VSSGVMRDLEKDRNELQKALDETIEDTIRQSWLPNTVGWTAVVVGAFVLNLVVLMAVTGG
jgi:pheromone shutdown protein TraB